MTGWTWPGSGPPLRHTPGCSPLSSGLDPGNSYLFTPSAEKGCAIESLVFGTSRAPIINGFPDRRAPVFLRRPVFGWAPKTVTAFVALVTEKHLTNNAGALRKSFKTNLTRNLYSASAAAEWRRFSTWIRYQRELFVSTKGRRVLPVWVAH